MERKQPCFEELYAELLYDFLQGSIAISRHGPALKLSLLLVLKYVLLRAAAGATIDPCPAPQPHRFPPAADRAQGIGMESARLAPCFVSEPSLLFSLQAHASPHAAVALVLYAWKGRHVLKHRRTGLIQRAVAWRQAWAIWNRLYAFHMAHGMPTAPIPLAKALCVDSRELIPESWVAVDKQGLDGVAASWLSTLPAVRSSVRNKLETSAHGTEAMFPRCLLLDALSHRVR